MGEGRILVQATVTAVSDDHFLYPCCVQCYSKILEDVQQNRWHCMKCGEAYMSEDMEWRYRLRLTIADTNEYRQVAVFGRTVQPFFGASANTFHRFLSHLQQTECDLADVVLKQAADMVFIGQSFLFGFASVGRQRAPMTVSCLSHVAETKGSNSDLIAVQMISPDSSHMTTVSQQMSCLFREIVSNSFDQVSVDEKTVNTSAESKSMKRLSSNQTAPKFFNSVLELSENSINSLVSILFSCENSLAKNSTASPTSLSTDSLGLKLDATTSEESSITLCNDHDGVSLHGQRSSETNPGEPVTENPELVEHDIEDTMNDSSLLLADRDTCLQELGERSMSYQIHDDSQNADVESLDTLLSSSKHLIVNRDDTDTMAVETGSENVWEDLPYSEDLEEFLSKANDCGSKSELYLSLTDHHRKFQKSTMKTDKFSLVKKIEMCDMVVTDCNMSGSETRPTNAHTESIECPRHDILEYSAQHCPDFSFKVKDQNDMDETCGYYRQKTLDTLCEMPESENLDEFLCLAAGLSAVSKTTSIKESENDHLLQDQNIRYKQGSSLDKLVKASVKMGPRKVISSQELEPWEEIQNSETFSDDRKTDISPVSDKFESRSRRNVLVMDVPSVPEANLDKYFADSFSESDCDQCSAVLPFPCNNADDGYQTGYNLPSANGNFLEVSSTRSNNHLAEGVSSSKETKTADQKHFSEDKMLKSEHEDSMIPFDETRDRMSSDLETEAQVCLGRKDKATTNITEHIENENQKDPSVPVHLFHSVGSVGSLNGSMELFDASCDLFEEEDQENFVQADCDNSGICQLSAVYESIDDSIKFNLPPTNTKREAFESQKKTVKFAKRLSHVSSIQLIDIRMKLNFGIPMESQPSPVKPCLRNNNFETVHQRVCTGPSVTNNPVQSDWDCPKEHFSTTDVNGGQDADFPISQDLFACSQTPDCSKSPCIPGCPVDVSVGSNLPNAVGRVQTVPYSDALQKIDPTDSTSRSMLEISAEAAEGQDNPLTKNSDLICSLFPSGLQKCLFKDTAMTKSWDDSDSVDMHSYVLDATQDSSMTPRDGSQLLFSQTENTCPRTRISSTPTDDSDPGDLLLSLTPDLFSP